MASWGRWSEATLVIARLEHDGERRTASLPDDLDGPDRPTHPGHAEADRRSASDAPPRRRRRRLGERTACRTTPAAQQEHRRPAIRRCELQPPRRHHAHLADLHHDRRERAGPRTILRERQRLLIVLRLREEEGVRREARLLEPRCVEIEPRQRPQHVSSTDVRQTCRDAREEKRRGRVVREGGRCRSDLVEHVGLESAASQTIIERVRAERQDRRRRIRDGRHPGAQRGDLVVTRGFAWHDWERLICSLYVPTICLAGQAPGVGARAGCRRACRS